MYLTIIAQISLFFKGKRPSKRSVVKREETEIQGTQTDRKQQYNNEPRRGEAMYPCDHFPTWELGDPRP